MIRYTMDVLSRLSDAGYSQNRIRREKLIGQATLTQLRHGDLVSWKTIDTICALLDCQPGDFLEYVREPSSSDTLPHKIVTVPPNSAYAASSEDRNEGRRFIIKHIVPKETKPQKLKLVIEKSNEPCDQQNGVIFSRATPAGDSADRDATE